MNQSKRQKQQDLEKSRKNFLEKCRFKYKDLGEEYLYALGMREERVTLYSQQVRALNLIYCLHKYKKFKEGNKIAIIGGGLSGITAAAAAAVLGIKVDLFEQRTSLCHLQSSCTTRWVDPYIYDWPEPGSDNPYARLPLLTWRSGIAASVIDKIIQKFFKNFVEFNYGRNESKESSYITLYLGASAKLIHKDNKLHVFWDNAIISEDKNINQPDSRGGNKSYGAIILATGFGVEQQVENGNTMSYWRNDTINQPEPGVTSEKPTTFLISGTGDGGLIDLLRVRLHNFNQNSIIDELIMSDELDNHWIVYQLKFGKINQIKARDFEGFKEKYKWRYYDEFEEKQYKELIQQITNYIKITETQKLGYDNFCETRTDEQLEFLELKREKAQLQELLKEEVLQELKEKVLQELRVEQRRKLTVEQLQELINQKIQELTVEQLEELREEVLKELREKKSQKLINQKIQELISQKIQELTVEQLEGLREEVLQESRQKPLEELRKEVLQELIKRKLQELIKRKSQELKEEVLQEARKEQSQELKNEQIEELMKRKLKFKKLRRVITFIRQESIEITKEEIIVQRGELIEKLINISKEGKSKKDDGTWLFEQYKNLPKKIEEEHDEKYKYIFLDYLDYKIKRKLRNDTAAILNAGSDTFALALRLDKASLFNTFITYRLYQLKAFSYMSGKCFIKSKQEVLIINKKHRHTYTFDHLIIRHGPDANQVLMDLCLEKDTFEKILKNKKPLPAERLWDVGFYEKKMKKLNRNYFDREFTAPLTKLISKNFLSSLRNLIKDANKKMKIENKDLSLTLHRILKIDEERYIQYIAHDSNSNGDNSTPLDIAGIVSPKNKGFSSLCFYTKSILRATKPNTGNEEEDNKRWENFWSKLNIKSKQMKFYNFQCCLTIPFYIYQNPEIQDDRDNKEVALILFISFKNKEVCTDENCVNIILPACKRFVQNINDRVKQNDIWSASSSLPSVEYEYSEEDIENFEIALGEKRDEEKDQTYERIVDKDIEIRLGLVSDENDKDYFNLTFDEKIRSFDLVLRE
ncbi:MAG: NAD(P)-binding protein [Crocosphaera sp.]|nr:NAD(P)-binding protein [Crocosphaera sp.]